MQGEINVFAVSFVAVYSTEVICSTACEAVFWCKSGCVETPRWRWDGEWQLSGGIRLTQITAQEITGGLPLCTARWLRPYIDRRLDQPQRTSLGRHDTLFQWGANGTERGQTLFALLWTHWCNDCVEIYLHVGGSVFLFSPPSVIFFCNLSFILKACGVKIMSLNKIAIFFSKAAHFISCVWTTAVKYNQFICWSCNKW